MADIAKGTTFSWNGQDIIEIVSISGPGMSHTAVDVTNLADAMKTFLPSGVGDGGEITLELNFEPDDTQHDNIVDDLLAGNIREIILVFADAGTTTYTFDAICTGFEPSLAVDDKLSATATFKVTDDVAIT